MNGKEGTGGREGGQKEKRRKEKREGKGERRREKKGKGKRGNEGEEGKGPGVQVADSKLKSGRVGALVGRYIDR